GSGKSGPISFGLFESVNNSLTAYSDERTLLLVLRNSGAKQIVLKDIDAKSFSLTDAENKTVAFQVENPGYQLANGEARLLTLDIPKSNQPQPWKLRVKRDADYFDSIDVTVENVRLTPRKRRDGEKAEAR